MKRHGIVSWSLVAVLGCLPVTAERDHVLEGYQYSTDRPSNPSASGETMCASTESNGAVRCWGVRSWPWASSLLPETIPGLNGLYALAVSDSTVCAMSDTEVKCATKMSQRAQLKVCVPTCSTCCCSGRSTIIIDFANSYACITTSCTVIGHNHGIF